MLRKLAPCSTAAGFAVLFFGVPVALAQVAPPWARPRVSGAGGLHRDQHGPERRQGRRGRQPRQRSHRVPSWSGRRRKHPYDRDLAGRTGAVAATSVYNNLAGQPCTVDLTGQDLGSLPPLTPGVYCFSAAAGLTGTLTLNSEPIPPTRCSSSKSEPHSRRRANSVVLLTGGAPVQRVLAGRELGDARDGHPIRGKHRRVRQYHDDHRRQPARPGARADRGRHARQQHRRRLRVRHCAASRMPGNRLRPRDGAQRDRRGALQRAIHGERRNRTLRVFGDRRLAAARVDAHGRRPPLRNADRGRSFCVYHTSGRCQRMFRDAPVHADRAAAVPTLPQAFTLLLALALTAVGYFCCGSGAGQASRGASGGPPALSGRAAASSLTS